MASITCIDPKRIPTYKSLLDSKGITIDSDQISQTYFYGGTPDKLFLHGNFLFIHPELARMFFDGALTKREMIVLLMILRMTQGFGKSSGPVQLSALPVKLTKTILIKTLGDLEDKTLISSFKLIRQTLNASVNSRYILKPLIKSTEVDNSSEDNDEEDLSYLNDLI